MSWLEFETHWLLTAEASALIKEANQVALFINPTQRSIQISASQPA